MSSWLKYLNGIKLTPAEDEYRTGQLGLENGITPSAKSCFAKAAKNGVGNAAYHLGIILFKEGKYKHAYAAFNLAEKSGANVPDLYAAISQISKVQGDNQKSEIYKKKFCEMTGLSSYIDLAISNISNDSVDTQELIFLDSLALSANVIKDTASQYNATDSAIQPRIIKELGSSDSAADSNKFSILPSWMSTFVLYIVIVVILMAIFILSSYIKWRKNQLIKIRNKKKTSFNKKLNKAAEVLSTNEKQGLNVDRTIGAEPEFPQIKAEPQKKEKKVITQQKQNESVNFHDKLDLIARKIEESRNSEKGSTKESTDTPSLKEKNPAKLELALRLQKEQQKLKKKNIESIREQDIPQDSFKLNEIAKKLGIEKSSLETKRSLEKLRNDESMLSKLKEKFTNKK